jgi:hypothetical protein
MASPLDDDAEREGDDPDEQRKGTQSDMRSNHLPPRSDSSENRC